MNKLKQWLVVAAALLLSAGLLLLTLPLALVMTSALFLTGIAAALMLRYKMRNMVDFRDHADAIIIEGNYRIDRSL